MIYARTKDGRESTLKCLPGPDGDFWRSNLKDIPGFITKRGASLIDVATAASNAGFDPASFRNEDGTKYDLPRGALFNPKSKGVSNAFDSVFIDIKGRNKSNVPVRVIGTKVSDTTYPESVIDGETLRIVAYCFKILPLGGPKLDHLVVQLQMTKAHNDEAESFIEAMFDEQIFNGAEIIAKTNYVPLSRRN
jgi:hypothetical protein